MTNDASTPTDQASIQKLLHDVEAHLHGMQEPDSTLDVNETIASMLAFIRTLERENARLREGLEIAAEALDHYDKRGQPFDHGRRAQTTLRWLTAHRLISLKCSHKWQLCRIGDTENGVEQCTVCRATR